ncbi:MAG: hypothetical protein ABIZ09_14690 [Rhodoferax sp.]
MAREPSDLPSSPLWSRRLLEWGIVALVLIGLIWAFGREVRSLQGQSEKVLVWSTLASLRTALVINQLARRVRPDDRSLVENDPFKLLERVPPNFAGEMPMRDAYVAAPGSWLFDVECRCVGYRLLYPEWLEPPQETDTIWFRIGAVNNEARLIPLAEYRWFGQRL